MLYRLEVENFYSVRDRTVLDLRVGKNVSDYPERFAPIFPSSEERVAKAVALFGPNGSGKSTVLKAIAFISWFLKDSFHNKSAGLPCERFNDESSENREIRLAIELGGVLDFSGQDRDNEDLANSDDVGTLRYELHLRPEDGFVRTVTHEALRMRRNGKGRWQRVFERSLDRDILGSKHFSLSGFSQVVDKIRDNASVVSTLSLFEHQQSKLIAESAGRIQKNIFLDRIEFADEDAVKYLAKFPNVAHALNRELQRIDVGIDKMSIVTLSNGPVAIFKHKGLHHDMPLPLESHGTRSFIRIFPLIFLALDTGGLAVIDELDQSIHPLIVPEIIRWFYDIDRNKNDAQILMSCHSASLLDDLTKEQVVFCEKDQMGRSIFYSLMDVSAVRRSENLYKNYLGGVYGAVPQVG